MANTYTTSSEAVTILHNYIKDSILFTDAGKPNGTLYRFQRPENSVTEDVVVDILGLNRDDIQEGILKVNIFVPNRETLNPLTNERDFTLPNTARLEYLNRLAEDSLQNVWDPTGKFTFTAIGDIILPDENNQHFIHYRVQFFIQTLY